MRRCIAQSCQRQPACLAPGEGCSSSVAAQGAASQAEIAELDSEMLVAALWQINRLRRSLAVLALTWSARLQDPAMSSMLGPLPSGGVSLSPANSYASHAGFLHAPRISADQVLARPPDTAYRLPHSRSQQGLDLHQKDSEEEAAAHCHADALEPGVSAGREADGIARSHSCPLVESPSSKPREALPAMATPAADRRAEAAQAPHDANSHQLPELSANGQTSAEQSPEDSPEQQQQQQQRDVMAPIRPRSPQAIPRGMVAARRAMWEQPVIPIPAWGPLKRANTASDSVLQWLNTERRSSPHSGDPAGILSATGPSEATGAASDTDDGTDVDEEGSESGRSDRSRTDSQPSRRRMGISRFARGVAGKLFPLASTFGPASTRQAQACVNFCSA